MNDLHRFSVDLRSEHPAWKTGLIFALLFSLVLPLHAGESEAIPTEPEERLSEEGDPDAVELVIEEEGAALEGEDELVIEGEKDSLVIEEEGSESEEELTIEEDPASPLMEAGDDQGPAPEMTSASDGMSIKVDEVWAEYGVIPDSNSFASGQLYGHAKATAHWMPSGKWEFQLSGRVDGYEQFGGPSLDDVRLDYEETFARYRSDKHRFTLGTQKVIWGRLDEIPPTDRVSTHDLTRYILDDLSDRRRANPAVRLESFFDRAKLDLVYLPIFREAELPDKESVWYPVNQRTGEIIGLKSTPESVAIIKNASIDDDAPSTDGGFGIRYSGRSDGLDYAATVQETRQSSPYFAFIEERNVLEAKYPRSWVVGGDFGFEAAGATWRFEAAWLSDTPVTRVSGVYDTTESLSWGGGVDLFPGDGDTRLTLQLMGMNLIDSPAVIDREEIYLFNGSLEMPFAANQWRAEARFYIGLDERDVYLNPTLTYTGWESQEVYLGGHYFDGAEGTPGGYHENDSMVTLGWRARF